MIYLENHFQKFRQQVIGNDHTLETPYGLKKMLYADWTATGRLYRPIEEILSNHFASFFGNTHSEASHVGALTTEAYAQSIQIIKNHVNASENDALLFTGYGATSAINKLQRLLGLRIHDHFSRLIKLSEEDKPIIFVTHMEHHSNHTSWLETIGDVVVIQPDPTILRELLKKYQNRKRKIGSFTACSNVTGIKTPYYELAKVMHEHDGLCFVDFSASAPYVPINMHPENPMEKLDGIFFSPHKFLGGPGSSGVLIVDKSLCTNPTPDHPGGGTVEWTNPWGEYRYLSDFEAREDGGTPGILQAIRTALCIKLKEDMDPVKMENQEKELVNLFFARVKKIKNLHILDGEVKDRIGIVSFYIENIHYNLLVRLLNDRYGIQARGGCSCAGTYGHYLLNIDKEVSNSITNQIDSGDLSMKPGWVRISLHPMLTGDEVMEITNALSEISENIDEWQKDYSYNRFNNSFTHMNHEIKWEEKIKNFFSVHPVEHVE